MTTPSPFCIIAVSPNCWGRGKTVKEAIRNLVKAHGRSKDCMLRFVLGDDLAYVNDLGDLMVSKGAESFKISEN